MKTLDEYIKLLQALSDDGHGSYRVVTSGYEGGVADVMPPEPVKIVLNVHDQWYYGSHEIVDDPNQWHDRYYDDYERVPAVLIP